MNSRFMLGDFICCGCKMRGVQIKHAAFLQQELKYYFAKAWSWLVWLLWHQKNGSGFWKYWLPHLISCPKIALCPLYRRFNFSSWTRIFYFSFATVYFSNVLSGAVVGCTLHKIRHSLYLYWIVARHALRRKSCLWFPAIKYLLCCL